MTTPYAEPVLAWFARHARDLPWREPGTTPWSVLVSEIMLQQTPVARVVPAHRRWLDRWPTPTALAAEPAGEAIRQWGRLGYPRRALRLHQTATIVTERHGGIVPDDIDALLALPGIGSYTAAAVASFAFGQRHAVLDTNVRRVLARLVTGQPQPRGTPSLAERRMAESLLPAEPAVAARWSVAVMELGALVCTAASPRCTDCPVAAHCAWLAGGRPPESPQSAQRRVQRYDGTDRQCRGRLLAVLRDGGGPVTQADLDVVWADPAQLARALDGLVADGLVDPLPDGRYALPGHVPALLSRFPRKNPDHFRLTGRGARPQDRPERPTDLAGVGDKPSVIMVEPAWRENGAKPGPAWGGPGLRVRAVSRGRRRCRRPGRRRCPPNC
jgi:A/G-specific adenine glycosylase